MGIFEDVLMNLDLKRCFRGKGGGEAVRRKRTAELGQNRPSRGE